ncbi:MAG: SET domain-containing protein-lysine N-methyltransferase [Terriglobales bacterium]
MGSFATLRAHSLRSSAMCVIAGASFAAGELLLELEGDAVSSPSRCSIQIGRHTHLVPCANADCVWRYLNHSCRPNAIVRGRRLVALAPIAVGDEVTFDYNCTEYEMAAPFRCRCGHCDGVVVGGFHHLNEQQRRERHSCLAPYLELAAAAGA